MSRLHPPPLERYAVAAALYERERTGQGRYVDTSMLGGQVAMLTYQLADTYGHRHLFPVAWLAGIVVLGGAYVVLKHVFRAQGSVGIIIEIVGGTAFLIHVLRKGRL